MPLVEALARRHGRRGAEHDDLVQAGSIGLLNAIERFDPEARRGVRGLRGPHRRGRDEAPHPRPDGPGATPPAPPRGERAATPRSRRADGTGSTGRRPQTELAREVGVSTEDLAGLENTAAERGRPSRAGGRAGRASWMRASRACCSPGPSRASTTPIARSSTCASSANSAGVRSPTSSASRRARSRAARTPLLAKVRAELEGNAFKPGGQAPPASSPSEPKPEPEVAPVAESKAARRSQRPADAAHAPVAAHGAGRSRRARGGEPEPVHHQHARGLDALACGERDALQRRRAGCPPRS